MHLMNPVKPATMSASMLLTLVCQESVVFAPMPTNTSINCYLDILYKAPRSKAAHLVNKHLNMAYDWLSSLWRPSGISDHIFELTICYAGGFFVTNGMLWKHDLQGAHKRVLFLGQWTTVIEAAHNNIGHCRFYATHALLMEHYWWPFVSCDVA